MVTAAWLAVSGAGLWAVWRFDNTAGAAAHAPTDWPAESRLAREEGRPTLLLAHPQCSCTAATLVELGEVLARANTRPKTYVLFLKPFGVTDAWLRSGLWQTAARLPGVSVLQDDEGFEARRVGALTSGQAVLYDAHGKLVFSGGIRAARAHAGDNAGRQSLVASLNGGMTDQQTTSVFGCPLFNVGG